MNCLIVVDSLTDFYFYDVTLGSSDPQTKAKFLFLVDWLTDIEAFNYIKGRINPQLVNFSSKVSVGVDTNVHLIDYEAENLPIPNNVSSWEKIRLEKGIDQLMEKNLKTSFTDDLGGAKFNPKGLLDVDSEKGGWLYPVISSDLLNFSPKLQLLIDELEKNPQGQHIIYSRFIDHGGLKLISTILEYKKFSPNVVENPGFNENFLVINGSTLSPQHIHFFEGVDFSQFQQIFQNISPNVATISSALIMHFYVNGKNNQDYLYYKHLSKKINKQIDFYSSLIR